MQVIRYPDGYQDVGGDSWFEGRMARGGRWAERIHMREWEAPGAGCDP